MIVFVNIGAVLMNVNDCVRILLSITEMRKNGTIGSWCHVFFEVFSDIVVSLYSFYAGQEARMYSVYSENFLQFHSFSSS